MENVVRKIDTTHVVKLSDKNFEQWRLQISLILRAADLWDVVSGLTPRPEIDFAAWDKKDVQAMAVIVPTLDAGNTNHIFNCKTSKELFDKLKSIHSDASTLNKQQTLAKFLNYKFKEGESLVACYTDLEQLSRSLQEMGVAIDEVTTITKIVSALPEKHKPFQKAWDSVPSDSQTMANLLSRLRKEELEESGDRNADKSISTSKAFQAKMESVPKDDLPMRSSKEIRKKTKCFKCNKMGHWANECRRKGKQNSNFPKKQSEGNGSAYMVRSFSASSTDGEPWYCDSGASQHVCGEKEKFSTFTAFTTPHYVYQTDKKKNSCTWIRCGPNSSKNWW